jgi:hypothetical protein
MAPPSALALHLLQFRHVKCVVLPRFCKSVFWPHPLAALLAIRLPRPFSRSRRPRQVPLTYRDVNGRSSQESTLVPLIRHAVHRLSTPRSWREQ